MSERQKTFEQQLQGQANENKISLLDLEDDQGGVKT
jgi:hypothetical protein